MVVCRETAPFKTISIANSKAYCLQEATIVNYLLDTQTLHLTLASKDLVKALYLKVWTRFRTMEASQMVEVQSTDSIPKLASASKTCKRSKNLDSLDKREGRSIRAT